MSQQGQLFPLKRTLLALAAAASTASAAALPAQPALTNVQAPMSSLFRNCTALNRVYPHGVGRYGARDHTKSGDPVTNFRRSNRLYLQNRSLDRDRDGIACEKS
jgi:Excalibur calcium-binding domain